MEPGRTHRLSLWWRIGALVVLLALFPVAPVRAFDRMYPAPELLADQPRLERAVRRIFNEGMRPVLTAVERQTIDNVEFQFPLPAPGDDPLNFFAGRIGDQSIAILPVLSLKVLEDLTTALAWLHHNRFSASTIDTYFTMLRYRPQEAFPNATYPPILTALGIPPDALSNPAVDRMALSLRNEAILFLLAHELGHIHLRHQGYADITKARARADEAEADAFAVDIMLRTNTPPMGALIYFKAQAYSLLHRGEFPTEAAFQRYLDTSSTHPLTVERMTAIAVAIRERLARVRANERAIWLFIATELGKIIETLSDTALQRCLATVARRAPMETLKPRRDIDRDSMGRFCGNR